MTCARKKTRSAVGEDRFYFIIGERNGQKKKSLVDSKTLEASRRLENCDKNANKM